jgi:sec-independent protein translocase protein TatA
VIPLIVLVLFGGSKLPDIARSLGRSMDEFKKGLRDGDSVVKDAQPEEKQKAVERADRAERRDGE